MGITYTVVVVARRNPKESAPSTSEVAPTEPVEFVVGRPEFRIGDPKEKPTKAPSPSTTDFVIGGPPGPPRAATRPVPTEFRIGGPLPSTGLPAGLPPLPRGWEPLPFQPPWTFPEDEPTEPGELRRIEKPRKRYRGLSAIRAYINQQGWGPV